ncbi:MAG: hypothetical protein QOJ89_4452 [bacterium]
MVLLRASSSLLSALALALLVATPATARGGVEDRGGDGGRGEARVAGRCSGGGTSQLRLRSRDGAIALEFEVSRRRASEGWRVVVVHERRVAWRGTARTGGSGGSFRVRRSLGDLDGPDLVTVRASGPGGVTCRASATLLE